MHQSFKPPAPPIRALAGDCRDFHLIYTSFWFPGRRGIRLKSRSSHPLPGYLLAAQRSICLFHGCQQCFLTSVLRLAITSCFTKAVLLKMLKSRGRGMHHSLFSPGSGDFTQFHLHKKWMPRSWPNWGVRGFQMAGALTCNDLYFLSAVGAKLRSRRHGNIWLTSTSICPSQLY